jgi:hypothetical protein
MGAFGKEKPGHGALGRAGHQVRAHHEPVTGKPVGESAAEEQEDDLGDRRGAITTPSLVAESPAWPKRQMPARSAPWTCRAASQRARPGHSGTRAHAGGRDRAAPSPLARHSRTLPPGSQSGQATDYRATGQHATLHSAASGKYPGTLARACQNYVHDRRVRAGPRSSSCAAILAPVRARWRMRWAMPTAGALPGCRRLSCAGRFSGRRSGPGRRHRGLVICPGIFSPPCARGVIPEASTLRANVDRILGETQLLRRLRAASL